MAISPEMELEAVCCILRILSVKKDAKSLHDLIDSNSGGTDAEGFFFFFFQEGLMLRDLSVCQRQ